MKLGRLLDERIVKPLRQVQGSPSSIARGATMGVFVALTPTVGLQMAIVAVLGIPLRANIPLAVAVVWISNPFTVVPMYFGYYWLGTATLGVPTRSYAELKALFGSLLQVESVGQTFRVLGWEVAMPMSVGSALIATVGALVTYPLVLVWSRRRRERRMRKAVEASTVQPTLVRSPPEDLA